MDVHASPAELPELQEFLASFQVRFRRPEGLSSLERYTTGLLTEVRNKNCDTLAQAVPGTSEQRLQEFLTNMPWDAEALNRKRSGGHIPQIQETSEGWPLKEQVTASTKIGKVGLPRRRHVSRTERIRSTQRSPFAL
jgi:SRSO17 transposase